MWICPWKESASKLGQYWEPLWLWYFCLCSLSFISSSCFCILNSRVVSSIEEDGTLVGMCQNRISTGHDIVYLTGYIVHLYSKCLDSCTQSYSYNHLRQLCEGISLFRIYLLTFWWVILLETNCLRVLARKTHKKKHLHLMGWVYN